MAHVKLQFLQPHQVPESLLQRHKPVAITQIQRLQPRQVLEPLRQRHEPSTCAHIQCLQTCQLSEPLWQRRETSALVQVQYLQPSQAYERHWHRHELNDVWLPRIIKYLVSLMLSFHVVGGEDPSIAIAHSSQASSRYWSTHGEGGVELHKNVEN
jgi:hypothetical protein